MWGYPYTLWAFVIVSLWFMVDALVNQLKPSLMALAIHRRRHPVLSDLPQVKRDASAAAIVDAPVSKSRLAAGQAPAVEARWKPSG